MMGVKGILFLDKIWEIARENGCRCGNDDNYAQDVLGAVMCQKCKKNVITQYQVDVLEEKGVLPKSNITNKYLRRTPW